MPKRSITKTRSFLLLAGSGALLLTGGGCFLIVDGGSGGGGGTSTGGSTGGGTSTGGSVAGAAGSTTGGGGAGGGLCPADQPSFDGSQACDTAGLHCDYGQECCDNNCYASYSCDCTGGLWSCYFTDACLPGPGCDPGLPNVDDDLDGYNEEQGDCNDCDPNVNPAAAEIVAEADPNDPNAPVPEPQDDDCDGKLDTDDPDLQPCDSGLALDSTDPMDAVRAIGICDVDSNGDPKFSVKAAWVLADGLPPGPDVDMVKYHLGHGLVDHYGQNDVPREGARMLALSTGTARNKDEPGFVSRNFDKGYSSGPPQSFTGEIPACPGVTLPTSAVQDAAGLEVEMVAPSNARSLEFRLSFRTYDFPQFGCTMYDDAFWANLVQGVTNKNIAFDAAGNLVSVNASFLTQCDCPPAGPGACGMPGQAMFDCQAHDLLDGTDFDGNTNPKPTYDGWTNAGTPWLRTTAPVTPNETLKLRFVVFDSGVAQGQGDHNLDSMVTIDRFRWRAVDVQAETTPE